MPAPQIASLPEFFTLDSGKVIRLTAIDPTTGALVSGVTISEVKIDVDPEPTDTAKPPQLADYIPIFTYGVAV